MSRPPAPVDPEAGPLAAFAAELRDLRDRAGIPSMRALAKSTDIPMSTLYAISAGKRVPSAEALTAYVKTCGGDSAAWLAKRSVLQEQLAAPSSERMERWTTYAPTRLVMLVVRTPESLERVLAAAAAFEADHRIQLIFTIDQPPAPDPRLHKHLKELGVLVTPWRQAVAADYDLIIAAHASDRLRELRGPIAQLAVGAKGDPVYEQLLASRQFRSLYRRALGVRSHHHLVVLSSTWGSDSLLNEHPDLPLRLLAELPADAYKVSLVLHPNIWRGHGRHQVRMWHQHAVESGLLLIDPDDGWQPIVAAADAFIGDAGSVSLYSAMLGIPAIDTKQNLPGQLANAVHELTRPARSRPLPEEAGHAAHVLRTKFYEMLSIDEPSYRAAVRALPPPAHTQVREPASFRVVVREASGEEIRLERYPFVPGDHAERDFIVATDRERDTRVMHEAEVVVVTDPSPLAEAVALVDELHMTYPAARLTAAAAEPGLVITSRPLAGTSQSEVALIEASKGVTPDPALVAAAAYLRLHRGLDVRIRTGPHDFMIKVDTPAS